MFAHWWVFNCFIIPTIKRLPITIKNISSNIVVKIWQSCFMMSLKLKWKTITHTWYMYVIINILWNLRGNTFSHNIHWVCCVNNFLNKIQTFWSTDFNAEVRREDGILQLHCLQMSNRLWFLEIEGWYHLNMYSKLF
jgi:hypothetical protein